MGMARSERSGSVSLAPTEHWEGERGFAGGAARICSLDQVALPAIAEIVGGQFCLKVTQVAHRYEQRPKSKFRTLMLSSVPGLREVFHAWQLLIPRYE